MLTHMESRVITVPTAASGIRLDKFLVSELGGQLTRRTIQTAIKTGVVLVNGHQTTPHHFLKTNDTVTMTALAQPQPQIQANSLVVFKLIAENADYIVLDKPAGLIVHPAPGVHEPTLVDGLIERYPELKAVGEDPLRPGIVHRLDREVSGLMVVARTQPMFAHLKAAFAARQVDKRYIALVVGKMSKPDGTITFPLSRAHGRHGRMAARPTAANDTRDAITHYAVQKQYQQVALLDIAIETGRTHQIRAHLAALDHPIVGDRLYRPKSLAFKANPGRIFLHASSLSFTDQAGVRHAFERELPAELTAFLATLR